MSWLAGVSAAAAARELRPAGGGASAAWVAFKNDKLERAPASRQAMRRREKERGLGSTEITLDLLRAGGERKREGQRNGGNLLDRKSPDRALRQREELDVVRFEFRVAFA